MTPAVPGTATPTDGDLDPRGARLALSATGRLGELNRAGVLEAADVHVAQRVARLASPTGEPDPQVLLAVAVAVRAVRGGSVCVDLTTLADDPDLAAETWPDLATWLEALRSSPLVTPPEGSPPVLRLHGDRLLYLDRYWREEVQVAADLLDRLDRSVDAPPGPELDAALDRVFPASGYDEQREAARVAVAQSTTVLTGGPGTGKTTTVAGLLAVLLEHEAGARVALAAPTGKAAARLQQAVEEEVAALPDPADRERLAGLRAVTLHRLLGWRPGSENRFRHHRGNRLPHQVVVVDETSMVSLTMMARLLEAVRPEARLLLVGDPDQLTSVEAGAVLADLVGGLQGRGDHHIARLRTSHRFGPTILRLAEAVRAGDADETLAALRAGDDAVRFLEHDDGSGAPDLLAPLRALFTGQARRLRDAAVVGRADDALRALDERRVLCAHREGPYGVRRWNDQVERWLSDDTGEALSLPWYPGRPVLVTANDYGLGVYNGDVGVCVQGPDGLRTHVAGATAPVDLAPGRLGDVETMHAMTIHKSQGSQAGTVVVLLPPPESRLLTRELLYTAITRARDEVVVVGSADDVRAAVGRRARRATGLGERLSAAR